MGQRKVKSYSVERTDRAVVPAPYNQLYPPRDPEVDRLVSWLMLASEALHQSRYPLPLAAPDSAYASCEEGCPSPPSARFASLLVLLAQIEECLAAEPALAEIAATLPVALGGGDSLRLLFELLFCSTLPSPKLAYGHALSDAERRVLWAV